MRHSEGRSTVNGPRLTLRTRPRPEPAGTRGRPRTVGGLILACALLAGAAIPALSPGVAQAAGSAALPAVAWMPPVGGVNELSPAGDALAVSGLVAAAGTSPAVTPLAGTTGRIMAVHASDTNTVKVSKPSGAMADSGQVMASGASPAIAGRQRVLGISSAVV